MSQPTLLETPCSLNIADQRKQKLFFLLTQPKKTFAGPAPSKGAIWDEFSGHRKKNCINAQLALFWCKYVRCRFNAHFILDKVLI